MGVFAELKRRNVFRVAAAYVVVSWLILQVAAVLEPALRLPDWFDTFIAVVLLIGFPIALVLSWAFELTPEGVKRAVPGTGPAPTGALDLVLVLALVVLIGFLGYREFSGPDQSAQQTTETAAASDPITIVVLPFSDISPSGDQDFLAQGVSVELAKMLINVPGLAVRQLRGRIFDAATLGDRSAKGYVLDGAVQKAGDSVQITARLMSADDEVLTWADDYKEAFSVEALFEIQNKIASAIVSALQVPLKLEAGQSLGTAPTGNTEAFQGYLRALALHRQRKGVEATELLIAVLALEPEFAEAWALMAQVHTNYAPFLTAQLRSDFDASVERAKRSLAVVKNAADRAYELEPNSVQVLIALAGSQRNFGPLENAEDTYLLALEKDPNNPEALEEYSQFLRLVGKMQAAREVVEKLVAIEPSVPVYQGLLGSALYWSGDVQAAIDHWESGIVDPNLSFVTRSHALYSYFDAGQYEKARATLQGYPVGQTDAKQLENIDQVLAALANGTPPPEVDTTGAATLLILMWPRLGYAEAFIDKQGGYLRETGYRETAFNLTFPLLSPARRTEGFKQLAIDLGLVDYWRERGWADFCRPLGEDDFECE